MTRREGEVLDALGDRLSNAEIAARLYVSERTVESHVSSLLRKLGAGNRRELARMAELANSQPAPAPGHDTQSPHGIRDEAPRLVDRDDRTTSTLAGGFIGRSEELATLSQALEDSAQGRTHVVVVTGEAGIGKSRLSEVLAGVRWRLARGHRVVWGRCHEGDAPALWPWVQIARAHPASADRAAVEPIPDLTGADDHASLSEHEGARFRLFDSVTEFIRRSARHQPLVLLDDVHAADESTLLLLQFAARHLDVSPVLIVTSARTVDVLKIASLLGHRRRTTSPPDSIASEARGPYRGRDCRAHHRIHTADAGSTPSTGAS